MTEFTSFPYISLSSFCHKFMVLKCFRNKCVDPCPGVCGYNANCRVVNHSPVCSCLPNYVGDPFVGCSLQRKYSMLHTIFRICYICFFYLGSTKAK